MRVLFWSGGFPPSRGGVEVLAGDFVRDMRRRGHELLVIAPGDDDLPDESEHHGVPVRRFPFLAALEERDLDRMLRITHRVADLKRTFEPHLIHVNHPGLGVIFHRQTARIAPSPVLVTMHGAHPDWSYGPDTLYGPLLRTASWVVACSSALLRVTLRQMPEIADRSSAIPSCLEPPALAPAPLRFDAPRLFCAGRLSPEKGFDLALGAFARVVDRFPTARLTIAGDGPERAALERQAAALDIPRHVEFLGWVPAREIPALVNEATVVIPSRSESLGLVAVQASQMARPIVSTWVGGIPEVVVDGTTGLLVEPGDRQALAEAITFLLRHPDKARRLGEAARRRVEAEFRWEDHLDAYDALYQELTRRAALGPMSAVGYPGGPTA
jgi:glycogen(starch) synthase